LIGRLIIDEPATGSWNMAVDAAILGSLSPDSVPTLRFYRWASPTISLGYFQAMADRSKHRESEGIDVVRRATGGGAIIHDRELTYSLTIPTPTQRTGAVPWLYERVHQCVIAALASSGIHASRCGMTSSLNRETEPFLCFQRRTDEDVIVAGYKVLGSAQRRGPFGVLQHGSLLLQASNFAPQLPGLIELAGATEPNLSAIIASEVAKTLHCSWQECSISAHERLLATDCERKRFGNAYWLGTR
jgi:lipoate-protein ligase A